MKAIFWKLYVVLCITFMCSLEAAVPTITTLTPDIGPAAGGNTVIITGTDFTNPIVIDVDFEGILIPVTPDSDTQITVTAPAGTAEATVNVTVINGEGTSNPLPYTYSNGPVVTSITPTFGPTTGGTTVTITGSDFTGATDVDFGANAATTFAVAMTQPLRLLRRLEQAL